MFGRLGALLALLFCLWALLVQPTSSSPTLATQVVDTETANHSDQLGGGPPALSHSCGGAATDYNDAVCCINGYVYLNGEPVDGATVIVTAENGQSITVETVAEEEEEHHRTPGHDEPHFGVSLSEGSLAVQPGQTVTITAEVDGVSKTRTFIAQSGAEQQDIVLPQSGGLSKRLDHAMAYDGQGVILFGGLDENARLNDTLRWNGQNWTRVMASASPPIRNKHAMAYDSVGNRIVLFGGYEDSDSRLNDTWQWDGTTWTNISPSTSPEARTSHAMVYDAARGQIVLFGGYDGENFLNDTWLWDGNTWTNVTPPNPPSGRANHAMAYDAVNQRVVLFGGGSDGNTHLGDTWLWDGNSWTQASPANSPAARYQHTMEYDMANGEVVLFSGFNGSYFNDTWLWNGTTWTEPQPQNSPQARREHAMAYDTTRERIVLFGGDAQGRLGDTWEWNGNNWELRATGDDDVPPADALPIATINHISPRDARQGSDSITFRGNGGDADGTDIIQNYRWTRDEGQVIGTQASFTLTADALYDFSLGTNTISFQVEDDEGTWSAPSEQSIYIRDGHADTGGDATWTLLIYAAADNNLDYWMGDNPNANGMLHRLSIAEPQQNVNVGILYDGSTISDTRLYILQDNGEWTPEAWHEPESRMDDMETLQEFIDWGYDSFESEYYALSLVDHANGIVGFGQDDSSPNNDDEIPFLTPFELREALRLATTEGERKIDVLHYDGCSFGLLEDAAIARGLAHYVVASPYTGWGIFAYDTYREKAGSASNPEEYAQAVAEEYALGVEHWGYAYTISVFDMAHFEAVNSTVSILGDTLVQYVDGDPQARISQLRTIRDDSQKYDDGKSDGKYKQVTIEIEEEDSYVDIVDFASNLQNEINDPNVTTAAANVQSSIEQGFVIYEQHKSGPFEYKGTTYTADLNNAHGLGIFYPRRSTGSAYGNYVQNRLFDTTADSGWTRFLLQGIPAQGNNSGPGLSENQLISPLIPQVGSVEHKLYLPSIQG